MEYKLTNEQERITSHLKGPAYVVAGAGTGKTFTMTERVQELIRSGTMPESILVMTFTNAAAREMLGRIRKNIGESAAGITACTYHSFCNKLMHMAHVPAAQFSCLTSGDDTDLIQMLKNDDKFAKCALPRVSFLHSLFSDHVNLRKSFEDLLFGTEKYASGAPMYAQIRGFYDYYTKYKKEHALANYDDMLLYGLEILQSKRGNGIRKAYEYVMIDESQDTNLIQYEIARCLSDNIMFIGDPEQSIYSFRGSDLKTYLSVPNQYDGMKIYTLSSNYRCTEEILAVANSVIEHDDIPYKAHLVSGKDYHGPKPVIVRTENQEAETEAILEDIKNTEDGKSLAVIYRNSAASARLEIELVKRRIPYTKRGGIKFFEMDCIRDMLALFRVFVNKMDALAWYRVLQTNRLIGEKRAQDIVFALQTDIYQDNPFTVQRTQTAMTINEQMDRLQAAMEKAVNAGFTEQLKIIRDYYMELRNRNLRVLKNKKNIKETTIEAEEQSVETAEKYTDVLIGLMQEYDSVESFLENVALDSAVIPEDVSAIGNSNEGFTPESDKEICLTTIHSAKGLEWDTVHIMDAVDGVFPRTTGPSWLDHEEDEGIKEERRCMYVAVTRARNRLFVHVPEKVFQYGKVYDGNVSRFLYEAYRDGLFELSSGRA